MPNTVTMDPTTGTVMHMTPHKFLVTMIDDAAYLGLMVYLYDMTGFKNVFIGLPEIFFSNPFIVQALRYGIMFASMIEIRRWLEMMGIRTELVSYYLDNLVQRVL